MLASHSFPGCIGTDRAFLQGRHLGLSQFADMPLAARHHERIAETSGISTVGKCYISTLARYPGDPQAWVSDLHDVRARCEERGWGCEGAIKVAPREDRAPVGRYQVAEELVEDYTDDVVMENPDLGARRSEVREEVATRLSGLQR
jgi:hypothetical protein